MEINKTYFGDCLEVMKLIDDETIDLVLCDLPYGAIANEIVKNCSIPVVTYRAGDFVKEAGGDWIRVLRVEGRNIYLDYDDGLNCLDVDDVIAWKHGK